MNKFNFDKILQNVKRMKVDLPKKLANETKQYFLASWKTESFDGQRWIDPKRKSKKGKSTRLRSQTLVQSGALRRAVNNSLKVCTWEKIQFDVSDVPYAAIHNFGLPMKNGARMPQRQFMGDTKELRRKQIDLIEKESLKAWQG